jgi:hypothetical protein
VKVTKHETAGERAVLTGMVTSSGVIGRVASQWREEGLFRSRWSNLVGGWCVDYHRKYGEAPQAHIEDVFNAWAETATDDATVRLVDKFLAGLSEDYEAIEEETNVEYIVDKASEIFNSVILERMASSVKGHVERGDLIKAQKAANLKPVEMGIGSGIDVLQDREAILRAFETQGEALITYPGDLGSFFGNQLGRDEFVAALGATGLGKTWWLIDIAWMGVRQNRKVAFFEVGDMSEAQIMKRFMCRAAGQPLRHPYTVEVPTGITIEGEGATATAVVNTEPRKFKGPLDPQKAWKACQKKTRRHKEPLLRLSVHANSSINVQGISAILDGWEMEGWIPDVVVIDYADILAPPPGIPAGEREGINENWKQMRSMSQSRHILVCTATQADAGSYEANVIRRQNFSDDRRKLDHVTGMFGINATHSELGMGAYRLNWLKRREDAYTSAKHIHVAHCLNLGRPHVKSSY